MFFKIKIRNCLLVAAAQLLLEQRKLEQRKLEQRKLERRQLEDLKKNVS